jgi:ribosome-binding factor A
MPKDFSRSLRVADQIQRELANLIRLEVKDPRVGMVTLTGVEVTPDYAHAKVFFTLLGTAAQQEAAQRALTHAAGFLRGQIGRRIKIHTTPELHFVFDESVERGARLSQLIDSAVASATPPDPATDGTEP